MSGAGSIDHEIALAELHDVQYGQFQDEFYKSTGKLVVDKTLLRFDYEEDLQEMLEGDICGGCYQEFLGQSQQSARALLLSDRRQTQDILQRHCPLFEVTVPGADHHILRDAQGLLAKSKPPTLEQLDSLLAPASSDLSRLIIRLALGHTVFTLVTAQAERHGVSAKVTKQAQGLAGNNEMFVATYDALEEMVWAQADTRAQARGIEWRGVKSVLDVLQRDHLTSRVVRIALDDTVWSQVQERKTRGLPATDIESALRMASSEAAGALMRRQLSLLPLGAVGNAGGKRPSKSHDTVMSMADYVQNRRATKTTR